MTINLDTAKIIFEKVCIRHYVDKKMTVVALVNGNQVFVGESRCHPLDQFAKKVGLIKALGRAFSAYKRYLYGADAISDRDDSYKISTLSEEDLRGAVNTVVFKR